MGTEGISKVINSAHKIPRAAGVPLKKFDVILHKNIPLGKGGNILHRIDDFIHKPIGKIFSRRSKEIFSRANCLLMPSITGITFGGTPFAVASSIINEPGRSAIRSAFLPQNRRGSVDFDTVVGLAAGAIVFGGAWYLGVPIALSVVAGALVMGIAGIIGRKNSRIRDLEKEMRDEQRRNVYRSQSAGGGGGIFFGGPTPPAAGPAVPSTPATPVAGGAKPAEKKEEPPPEAPTGGKIV